MSRNTCCKTSMLVAVFIGVVASGCATSNVTPRGLASHDVGIRDVRFLSKFYLQLIDVINKFSILDVQYEGALGRGGNSFFPDSAEYGMFEWDISLKSPEQGETSDVAHIILEEGQNPSALVVCNLDGIIVSLLLDETWDHNQVDKKLRRLGLPSLVTILKPLAKSGSVTGNQSVSR